MRPALAPAHDAAPRERTTHVVQGSHAVVSRPGEMLATILGSCVATCLWDPDAGVGGMNHFLLPGDDDSGSASMSYGVNAMELLVNDLLQRGAIRSRLKAKLFGGAHVIPSLPDIGARNAAFAERFLELEGIPSVAQSLGGLRARRVRFWPTTGRASQLLLDANSHEGLRTERASAERRQAPISGSVELF